MNLIGFLSMEGPVTAHPVVVPEPLLAELLAGQQEVFDLQDAAKFLKVSEDEVLRLVNEQGLPARQVRDGWRFLKAAVCDWLRAGTPPRRSGKESLLALAGAWKDDPHLEDMVEEIYRKRGRAITEDGSYRLFHGLQPEGSGK
jgi:excisionase family DNA binding protein